MVGEDIAPLAMETTRVPQVLASLEDALCDLEIGAPAARRRAHGFLASNNVEVTLPLLEMVSRSPKIRRTRAAVQALMFCISADALESVRKCSPTEQAGLSILLQLTAILDSPHYDHEVAISILRAIQRLRLVQEYDLVARLARNPDLFRIHPLISSVAKDVLTTLEEAQSGATLANTLLRPVSEPASDANLLRPATTGTVTCPEETLLRPLTSDPPRDE